MEYSRSGETGRCASLRGWWAKAREGSSPSFGTILNALVSKLVKELDLESSICEFESHRGHHFQLGVLL